MQLHVTEQFNSAIDCHYFKETNDSKYVKDTFSCGPINMKFAPKEICSISIPKPTDLIDYTVKVMWAELRKS